MSKTEDLSSLFLGAGHDFGPLVAQVALRRPGIRVAKQCRRVAALGVHFGARHGAQIMQRHIHRSEEHTSELQSLMRISYAVFCLKKKTQKRENIVEQDNNI